MCNFEHQTTFEELNAFLDWFVKGEDADPDKIAKAIRAVERCEQCRARYEGREPMDYDKDHVHVVVRW